MKNELVVQVESLVVRFPSENGLLTILDIPAFEVEQGEQVAIAGPSGSGKSTLLHVIAGLLVPSAGAIRVCGEDIAAFSEAKRDRFRAKHIGYIFQNFNLMQGYTALENVQVAMAMAHFSGGPHQAQALLDELGLAERRRHYPAQLSVGEQQRVAIARALAKRPALILADEPTGSLDPIRTRDIVRQLRDACRAHNTTLLVVSHESEVVNAFDRAVDFMAINRAFAASRAES